MGAECALILRRDVVLETRILKIELCSALQKGYILFVYLFLMILLTELAKLPFVISLQTGTIMSHVLCEQA